MAASGMLVHWSLTTDLGSGWSRPGAFCAASQCSQCSQCNSGRCVDGWRHKRQARSIRRNPAIRQPHRSGLGGLGRAWESLGWLGGAGTAKTQDPRLTRLRFASLEYRCKECRGDDTTATTPTPVASRRSPHKPAQGSPWALSVHTEYWAIGEHVGALWKQPYT